MICHSKMMFYDKVIFIPSCDFKNTQEPMVFCVVKSCELKILNLDLPFAAELSCTPFTYTHAY